MLAIFQALLGVPAQYKNDGYASAIALEYGGKCEAFCRSSETCKACSVDCSLGSNTKCQWVALPQCGAVSKWAGLIAGDISRKSSAGNATITLSGPADVWFGVGINAEAMADMPYTLIVNASGVVEQKLGTCGRCELGQAAGGPCSAGPRASPP